MSPTTSLRPANRKREPKAQTLDPWSGVCAFIPMLAKLEPMTEKPPAHLPPEGVTYHKVEKDGPLNREDVTVLLKERTNASSEGAPGVVSKETPEEESSEDSEQEETHEAKQKRELDERLAEQTKAANEKAAAAKKSDHASSAHTGGGHGGHHATPGTGPIATFFAVIWKMGAYFMREMGSSGGSHGGGGHAAPKKDAHGGGGHGH